jgi:hypothetical protein
VKELEYCYWDGEVRQGRAYDRSNPILQEVIASAYPQLKRPWYRVSSRGGGSSSAHRSQAQPQSNTAFKSGQEQAALLAL